ncbi:hypothetical protein BSFA1_81580 (plasmid) [Burkholderia sp. SFA1]|nr:hypothetical protein BSFA1_81580 [Burkholderia sp. SFA1]
MVYAKSLLPQIPQDSLTVFDKGFLAAEILCGLTMNASNRHLSDSGQSEYLLGSGLGYG